MTVAVVGDGPAGAAIAASLAELGVDVTLIGPGRPWTNTYGVWLDDVEHLPDDVFADRVATVVVGGSDLRRVGRAYGIVDNGALRAHLGVERLLCRDEMASVDADDGGAHVSLRSGDDVDADLAILATGAPDRAPPAWQTAYGVVVDDRAAATVAATDAATLMDWSWSGSIAGRPDVPSFLYVVPLGAQWLVEHTVLAASPVVDPPDLRTALVDRLGAACVEAAEADGRVETVRIPMGLPPERGHGPIARFGAAGGMLHPATGYSLGAALRAAPRVAQAIAAGTDVHDAIWPRPARRARALHDYGLSVLLDLRPEQVEAFFEAFFSLPVERWREYLRVDTTPGAVARTMAGVFRAAPRSVRGRLWRGDLGGLARGLVG